jgi:hypothetical protein
LHSARRRAVSCSAAASGKTVIPGDPRIGVTLLAVAVFLGPGLHLWLQFLLHGVLGGFLTFQSTRVRFRFDEQQLDVVFVDPASGSDEAAASASVESSGDNKLQGGGANAWSLDKITNWEFWWPGARGAPSVLLRELIGVLVCAGFPVLVYYKETQTRPQGQPHFFPSALNPSLCHLRGLSVARSHHGR